MNTVSVKKLCIGACHGVNDFEKVQPQRFIFTVDVSTDFSDAAADDDVNKTINYSAICKRIKEVTTGNIFNLIETLAYACAYDIMDSFPSATAVSLLVEKPDAPVKANFESVSVKVELQRQTAYLSIGSNMGDRKAYLDFAVNELNATRGITVEKASSYIETEPYGGVATGQFLNACVKVTTWLEPHVLLKEIHSIEAAGGRERTVRWGDRTLDIDIIFYGNKVINSEVLAVPHPDYANRSFVLMPLKEIAPDFVCPVLHKRIADIEVK